MIPSDDSTDERDITSANEGPRIASATAPNSSTGRGQGTGGGGLGVASSWHKMRWNRFLQLMGAVMIVAALLFEHYEEGLVKQAVAERADLRLHRKLDRLYFDLLDGSLPTSNQSSEDLRMKSWRQFDEHVADVDGAARLAGLVHVWLSIGGGLLLAVGGAMASNRD